MEVSTGQNRESAKGKVGKEAAAGAVFSVGAVAVFCGRRGRGAVREASPPGASAHHHAVETVRNLARGYASGAWAEWATAPQLSKVPPHARRGGAVHRHGRLHGQAGYGSPLSGELRQAAWARMSPHSAQGCAASYSGAGLIMLTVTSYPINPCSRKE